MSELTLHEVPGETVRLIRLAPGARVEPTGPDRSQEIYVIEGAMEDGNGRYPAGTWLRSPTPEGFSSREGALVYIKTGHLDAQITGTQAAE